MDNWIERNHLYSFNDGSSNFSISFAGMNFTANDLANMADKFARATREMKQIENGAIKNPDEKRKVTHFSDRLTYPKSQLFAEVNKFASQVRNGEITAPDGKKFEAVVVNGIGGSALGPQLMQFAVNGPYWNELSVEKRHNGLKIYFLDNTDSSGIADLIQVMNPAVTLVLTISKSGGTQETKNNLISLENYYAAQKVDFGKCAVAITMKGSELDKHATANNWLANFEMADSIGGRTSESSIVGHVPAVLTGIDFGAFLAGASHMDEITRNADAEKNPAAMLSAMWYIAGNGKGDRNMVIVPYSDRLILMSRYLQQLVMESLGKEYDLDGKVVHQGLNVFGNKGGTDAHAFIQQLNDGRDDFFATFIEVLKDSMKLPISGNIGMGDYLHGFQEGLSSALRSRKRQIITIKISEVTPYNLGMLIALYERAVAMYAEYININAFHQPGVQAYKLAAKSILALRENLIAKLEVAAPISGTAAEIAGKIGLPESEIEIAGLLDKAAFNCCCTKRELNTDGNWVYSITK